MPVGVEVVPISGPYQIMINITEIKIMINITEIKNTKE